MELHLLYTFEYKRDIKLLRLRITDSFGNHEWVGMTKVLRLRTLIRNTECKDLDFDTTKQKFVSHTNLELVKVLHQRMGKAMYRIRKAEDLLIKELEVKDGEKGEATAKRFAQHLKNVLEGVTKNVINQKFCEFGLQYAELLILDGESTSKSTTYQTGISYRNSIYKFINCLRKDIEFVNLRPYYLYQFMDYCKEELLNDESTVKKEIRNLAAIYKHAAKKFNREEILIDMANNPFALLDKAAMTAKNRAIANSTRTEYLTREELKQFEITEMPEYRRRNAIDLERFKTFFILEANIGLRISDFVQLKVGDVDFDRNFIKIATQAKTGEPVVVALNATAKAILKQLCEGKESQSFVLNYLSHKKRYTAAQVKSEIILATAKYNNALAKMYSLGLIPKKLTTHSARHTFANLYKDKFQTSVQLGHTSLKTIDNYRRLETDVYHFEENRDE